MEGRVEIARVLPKEDDSRESRLMEALDGLCGQALDEGAHACAVVEGGDMAFRDVEADTPDVPAEERSVFWPVPRFPKDSIRDAIGEYRWAVVFRLDVDGGHAREENGSRDNRKPGRYSVQDARESIFRIAGLLEACGHCPPHGDSVEEIRSKVAAYEKGVFFRIAADQGYLSAPGIAHCLESDVFDDEGALIMVGTYYILCFQIVSLIEKRACRQGYKPLGFAAGDCKAVLCLYESGCRALKDRAKCRHADLSRPSMEASGIDVFAMAANAGWDVYPLGGSSRPGDAPRGSLHGLVLVY